MENGGRMRGCSWRTLVVNINQSIIKSDCRFGFDNHGIDGRLHNRQITTLLKPIKGVFG
jgi:hypothetical protein